MTSRPKHVSSLSDKIAGLKFMQRAKAVQSQQQDQQQSEAFSTSSSSSALAETQASTNVNEKTIKVDDHEEQESEGVKDEHWSLPIPTMKQNTTQNASSASSLISHEPGWNAWLIEADDGQKSHSVITPATSSRRSFGVWANKSRKKKRKSNSKGSEESEAASNSEDDERSYVDSSDEKSTANDDNKAMKGFIKSGSTKEKPDTLYRKDKRSEKHEGGKRKEKYQGIKKWSSRDDLSGFPDSNNKASKKKKKTRGL